MTLINLIKDSLGSEDKNLISRIDLNKSNDETIKDLTEAGVLEFVESSHEDQETE